MARRQAIRPPGRTPLPFARHSEIRWCYASQQSFAGNGLDLFRNHSKDSGQVFYQSPSQGMLTLAFQGRHS